MEMKLDSFAVSICCCEYGFVANSPVLLEFAFHQNVVESAKSWKIVGKRTTKNFREQPSRLINTHTSRDSSVGRATHS